MKVKDFLKALEAARAVARNETSAMSERGELASALASEGYVGGYIAALNDVQAVLTHGHPADPRLYWDSTRQAEICTRKLTGSTREAEIMRLLKTVKDAGGSLYTEDTADTWLRAWCSDTEGTDMFNEACDRGLLRYGHDSDTDSGTVYLTKSGRAALEGET